MNDTLLLRDSDGRPAELRGFDRLMEAAFGESPFFGLRRARQDAGVGWAPAVDIQETETDLIAYVALPGLEKEDVALEVKDNTLVVTGRMKPLGRDEDAWVRRELPRGEFYRAFHLPTDVQVGKVKAAMSKGVLEIRLPKAEEARPRKIAID